MYAVFIETDNGNYAAIAPSKIRAGAWETRHFLANRVRSLAYCEFIEDEHDAAAFFSDYGADKVEVERVGF